MKVGIRILIGLGVVVAIIFSVMVFYYIFFYFIISLLKILIKMMMVKSNKDKTETTSTAQEALLMKTTYTKDEIFEIVDLYFPKVRCVLEKLFDDGLEINGNVSTLRENSDGKVVLHKSDLYEICVLPSLIYALENDNLNVWYNAYIGVVALTSESFSIIAKYDEEHEDPYSTLVIYLDQSISSSTTEMNKNFEDYVEPESLVDTTNADGLRLQYIKHTPKIQFDRNKEKIDDLKELVSNIMYYNYMVQCNSD